MPTSILDIQVDDASFKKFQEDFNKYNVTVQGLPLAWGRIEQAINRVAERVDSQTDVLGKAISATNKLTEGQDDYNAALGRTNRTWGSISRWTRMAVADGTKLAGIYGAISSRITNAAVSMLKWGTVGSLGAGLAGAGGLWGISNLASAAGATRRASQGLGLGPGELRAYETNFAKMFDARGVLGNLSSARNDPDRRWALISMGLDPNDTTANLGLQAPRRAKEIYEEGGQSLAYARARGLLEVFTEEDLQRLHAMTVQEIEASRQMVEQDRRRMATSDALARRWQSLGVQFDRSSQVIQTVFLDALSPLAPEIERLSDAFTEAVKTALTLDVMRTAINGLSTGIRVAGDYISSAEFLDDIRKFGAAVESVWRAVSRVAAWINGLFPGPAPAAAGGALNPGAEAAGGFGGAWWHGNAWRMAYGMGAEGIHRRPDPAAMGQLGGVPGLDVRGGVDPGAWLSLGGGAAGGANPFAEIEARRGLPAGLLDRIWERESRRGRHMLSPAGARGHFQFMPETGAQYGLVRDVRAGRDDFNDLGRASEAAGRYMQDLLARYQGDLAKATAAYNWGMRHVDTAVAEHGENWRLSPRMPRETREYLAAVVDPILAALRREGQPAARPTTPPVPRVDLRIENPAGARVAVIGAGVRAQ